MKEEIRLLPRLRRYEGRRNDPNEQNGFLEIASLIQAPKADHRKTLHLFSDIRQLLSSCDDEESSSISRIGTLFGQIDLHVRRRIYLQDEVLFPITDEGRGPSGG